MDGLYWNSEHPIRMDDLGVPLFLETPICILYICIHVCFLQMYTNPKGLPPNLSFRTGHHGV